MAPFVDVLMKDFRFFVFIHFSCLPSPSVLFLSFLFDKVSSVAAALGRCAR